MVANASETKLKGRLTLEIHICLPFYLLSLHLQFCTIRIVVYTSTTLQNQTGGTHIVFLGSAMQLITSPLHFQTLVQ